MLLINKVMSLNYVNRVLPVVVLCFFIGMESYAQTKRLKRPASRVGISSVDQFVRESFDIYDKVYMYDGYEKAGKPLTETDIFILENAVTDLNGLTASAPNVLGDIEGAGILKQGKATLQMNRAQKALDYSITTAKRLLTEGGNDKENDSEESASEEETSESEEDSNSQIPEEDQVEENISDNLEIYSKFDFVPGDKLLYFDDFSQDFIGDFPSKWNTNGSGEIVRLNNAEGNWLLLKSGYGLYYVPLVNNLLPEEYTLEFDFVLQGIDNKTSSQAFLTVMIGENNGFQDGIDYAYVDIPVGQFGAFDIRARNRNKGPNQINSQIKADIREAVLNKPHISIAANKNRFRLWVNQTKYVDIPQFLYKPEKLNYIKFNVKGFKDGKERIFISNIKLAEGGVDLRRKLMSEGEISTNGILFDSGSATIKPQSFGIIRQISQVLMQDESIRLMIEGHTDSDGEENSNLQLSKARAESVKKALTEIYKISTDRLEADGKGESMPVADNATSDGKAQNRRVVFKKI